MNIPFSPPDMTEAEVQGAADAIRSGWITTGPKTKELEHKINKIQDSINYIHWKQGFYDDVLSGKTKYYSNLVQTENEG